MAVDKTLNKSMVCINVLIELALNHCLHFIVFLCLMDIPCKLEVQMYITPFLSRPGGEARHRGWAFRLSVLCMSSSREKFSVKVFDVCLKHI